MTFPYKQKWSQVHTAITKLFSQEIVLVTAVIFGGCCSNVFTLEALTK